MLVLTLRVGECICLGPARIMLSRNQYEKVDKVGIAIDAPKDILIWREDDSSAAPERAEERPIPGPQTVRPPGTPPVSGKDRGRG